MTTSNNETYITISELLSEIVENKWKLVLVNLLAIIMGVLLILFLPKKYEAEVILAPVSQGGSGSLGNLANQFGGLASLAGISLGGGENDKALHAQTILVSWDFIEKFIEQNNLAAKVFAVKSWDKASNTLSFDEGLYNQATGEWTVEGGESLKPTSWELFEEFEDILRVSQDTQTGLVKISIEHHSPEVAKLWVDLLVESINNHMRSLDIQDSKKNIEYLNEQIEKTSIAEMQKIFYQLIEEQTKTLMLAHATQEYVLKTISPAKIPEEKSFPSYILIALGAAVLGAFLSFIVIVLSILRKVGK
ncbi:MAG: LPS O-antigen length regulator [Cyclobacteriaceae bacterium]|nr:LPS O-antigen length regulator [Cyclobacteriaceae bacterium]